MSVQPKLTIRALPITMPAPPKYHGESTDICVGYADVMKSLYRAQCST